MKRSISEKYGMILRMSYALPQVGENVLLIQRLLEQGQTISQ